LIITNELKEKIFELNKEGISNRGISRVIGCASSTIDDIIKKSGLISPFFSNKKLPKDIVLENKLPSSNTLTDSTKGNFKEIEKKTNNRIITLKDLVEECNIDLNIWNVISYKCNKWESASKNSLTNEVNVTPLFQVKATMMKKRPDEVEFPPLQSVNFNLKNSIKPIKSKDKNGVKKALIISDSHVGFSQEMYKRDLIPTHSREIWDIILQLLENNKFDKIIALGDMLDLTDFSDKFAVTPEFAHSTQSSLIELAWYFNKMRQLNPDAYIGYIEGNHEKRLLRGIVNNFKSAYGLMNVNNLTDPVLSVSSLLDLQSYGVEYIDGYPDGKYWINENLYCEHGTKAVAKSGGTVSNLIVNARSSKIQGHVHRMEMASKTEYSFNKAVTYSSYCIGCMCRIDGQVPANSKENNWQQGFAIVEYTDDGYFNVNNYSINNDKVIVDGDFFEGKSRIKEIYKDTKWEMFK